MQNEHRDDDMADIDAVLSAKMPDGCTVADYLEGTLPGQSDLAALGINVDGYGLSDTRADIHRDFYRILIKAMLFGVRDSRSRQIEQAVRIERERCALIAEGNAKKFNFQNALGEGDDAQYGWNSARLDIAKEIRAGGEPANVRAILRVKPLDEDKTVGWTDDKERFCLPLSAGYYIKFPKKDDLTPTYMAWFYHEPVGGSSKYTNTVGIAQDHHRRRILMSVALDLTAVDDPATSEPSASEDCVDKARAWDESIKSAHRGQEKGRIEARAQAFEDFRNGIDRTSIAKLIDPSAWKNEGGFDVEQAHSDAVLAVADRVVEYITSQATHQEVRQ
jgi:hypothetical protein|nr:hypothetical protein [Neorhizobium tomejilense]